MDTPKQLIMRECRRLLQELFTDQPTKYLIEPEPRPLYAEAQHGVRMRVHYQSFLTRESKEFIEVNAYNLDFHDDRVIVQGPMMAGRTIQLLYADPDCFAQLLEVVARYLPQKYFRRPHELPRPYEIEPE